MDDAITALLALAILVEAGAALIAGLYVAWVYRQRGAPSEYLRRLVLRDVRVAIGGIPILALVIYGLVLWAFPEWHLQPIPRPWGSLAIGVPVVIFLWGVIDDAAQFRADRKVGAERRDGGQ